LTQLQNLSLGGTQPTVTPQEVSRILAACKQLTSLALNYDLFHTHFDALLTHAPQLTSLTCNCLHLYQDRSASPCGLKELVFTRQILDLAMVACLPIAAVTHLAFPIDRNRMQLPSPVPVLDIWTYHCGPPSDTPDVIHRGLLNLTRCPAWQQSGPVVQVELIQNNAYFTSELLDLTMGALALLSSREVHLTIDMPEISTRGSTIQQLGEALGSSLKKLTLYQCDLSDDFWPAVWAHLPGLQQLAVTHLVHGSIGPEQLASFCSHAARPLQLNLGLELYEQAQGGGRLERQCRVWGVPQVTVARHCWPISI
jgi:hypothetical protein